MRQTFVVSGLCIFSVASKSLDQSHDMSSGAVAFEAVLSLLCEQSEMDVVGVRSSHKALTDVNPFWFYVLGRHGS